MRMRFKLIAMLLIISMVLGLAMSGFVYASGDYDDDNDTVTIEFGEPEGGSVPGLPGFLDPLHLNIRPNPDPIEEDTTVTFDLATFNPNTGSGFHQVIIYEAGTRDTDIVFPDFDFNDPTEAGLFINTGEFPLPGFPIPLDPDVVDLPDGVIAAWQLGADLTFTFEEPGTYLIIYNITPHFAFGNMFRFVTVVDDLDDDDDDD